MNARSFACGRPRLARKSRAIQNSLVAELSEKLDRYQTSRQLNRSQPRNRVLEVIAQQTDHFTGPELVALVKKRFSEIGPATVYRCLPLLLEAGILRESLTDREGQAVYELAQSDHHDHVVCLDCRAILEFHEVGIESLQAKVLQKLGFQEVSHSHVIYARCAYRAAKE
jgi:Fur family transcriptional regulator, ferric uptake regulator